MSGNVASFQTLILETHIIYPHQINTAKNVNEINSSCSLPASCSVSKQRPSEIYGIIEIREMSEPDYRLSNCSSDTVSVNTRETDTKQVFIPLSLSIAWSCSVLFPGGERAPVGLASHGPETFNNESDPLLPLGRGFRIPCITCSEPEHRYMTLVMFRSFPVTVTVW